MYIGSPKFNATAASPQLSKCLPTLDNLHVSAAHGNVHDRQRSHKHFSSKQDIKMSDNSSPEAVKGSASMILLGADDARQFRGEHSSASNTLDSVLCGAPPVKPNVSQRLINDEMLLRGNVGGSSRQKTNVKTDQRVKWNRKNITATMERFEPVRHSFSSTSSLEYGFAASVVTSSKSVQSQAAAKQQTDAVATHMAGPSNHVYSYAYYEPEVVASSSNASSLQSVAHCSQYPSARNVAERHTYTTRYGTTENLYEEVNDQKIHKLLSDSCMARSCAGSVKEEQRRVQHNHFRVLDQLNLSLEALIMPPTPPDYSPNADDDYNDDSKSKSNSAKTNAAVDESAQALTNQQMLFKTSLENLSSTLNSRELKNRAHSSCNNNPDLDHADLDSGFSGSGSSSGASYNDSVRYFKTSSGAANGLPTTDFGSLEEQEICEVVCFNGSKPMTANGMLNSSFSRCSDRSLSSTPSTKAAAPKQKSKKKFWEFRP